MPSQHSYPRAYALFSTFAAILLCVGTKPSLAACTCSAMTVKTSGTSQAYCVDTSARFDECTVVTTKSCPSGQKAVQCPLGPTSGVASSTYWMGYGFEVTSTISGTAAQCNNGQGLQRSITSDGTTVSAGKISYSEPAAGTYTVNSSSNSYTAAIDNDRRKLWPKIGATDGSNPLYGADNYSASSSTQTTLASTSTSLYWADLPSILFDDSDRAKIINLQDQAFTFVLNSGSGSTKPMSGPGCSCAIKYEMTKAPITSWSTTNLKNAITSAQTTISRVSCTVSP